MTTNALYSIAEEKGYQVYGVPLSELKSFAIEGGTTKTFQWFIGFFQ